MMQAFKDLFSNQSEDYASFRPTYPVALYDYLSSVVSDHSAAWDCATGNGQSAVLLAAAFDHVIATDPSRKQLAKAVAHPKIEYRTGTAENSGLLDHSVDLVAVAQAFHWFDPALFFKECRRVLKASAVLAFWCYPLAQITPEIDGVVMRLYDGVLGPYWQPERKLVDEGYRNVAVPFTELDTPKFQMRAEWNFDHLVGYLGTWSAVQPYREKHGVNPIEQIDDDLRLAWGAPKMREVTWDLSVRVFRV